MKTTLALSYTIMLVGLGCGGSEEDTCSHYTAYVGAGGPLCASLGDNRCKPGDRCADTKTLDCVVVLSDPSLRCDDTYSAYIGAGGPLCASAPASNRCVGGDTCVDAFNRQCKAN